MNFLDLQRLAFWLRILYKKLLLEIINLISTFETYACLKRVYNNHILYK